MPWTVSAIRMCLPAAAVQLPSVACRGRRGLLMLMLSSNNTHTALPMKSKWRPLLDVESSMYRLARQSNTAIMPMTIACCAASMSAVLVSLLLLSGPQASIVDKAATALVRHSRRHLALTLARFSRAMIACGAVASVAAANSCLKRNPGLSKICARTPTRVRTSCTRRPV